VHKITVDEESGQVLVFKKDRTTGEEKEFQRFPQGQKVIFING